MTDWQKECCSSVNEPLELEKISESTYVQRKNITKEVIEDEEVYTCMSRIITSDELRLLGEIDKLQNKLLNAETAIADIYEEIIGGN